MPIGLQLTAPHFEEARLVRLAHAYEQTVGWEVRPPEPAAGEGA
jgi:aspartyl-tRNA(Asn)/glutamyl-tRNA(Gln) amidotransferase subunit A